MIHAPRLVVTVDGVTQPAPADLSVSGEIPTDMSLPWVTGTGITPATCDVTWTRDGGLHGGSDHPWLPGLRLSPGTPVTVDLVWDDPEGGGLPGPAMTWRLFTGSVESYSTDLGSGVARCRLVDLTTRLNRPVTIDPVAYKMPPTTTDGSTPQRFPGMSPAWVTGEVWAACGFYPHQRQDPSCDWFASNLGSAWPRVGAYLQEAYSSSRGEQLAPRAVTFTNGNAGLIDLYAHGRTVSAGNGFPRSLTVDIDSFDDPGAVLSVTRCHDLGGDGFGFVVLPHVIRMITQLAGVQTIVATWTRTPDITRISAFYDGVQLTGSVTNGTVERVSVPFLGQFGQTGRDTILVNARNGAKVGAVQGSRSSGLSVLTQQPNAAIMRDLYDLAVSGSMGAVPFINGQNALQLLNQQASAEMLSWWITEDGTAVMADRGRLNTGPVAHVLTDDDFPDEGVFILRALSASLHATEPRSQVVVKGRRAAVQTGNRPSHLLATGPKETLLPGDEFEFYLQAASDEDWLRIDMDRPLRYAGNPQPAPYDTYLNRRIGTWVGGHMVDDDGNPVLVGGSAWVKPDMMPIEFTRIDANTVLVTGNISNDLPQGTSVLTQISPTSQGAWASRVNDPLPELRGYKLTWVEQTDTAPGHGDPLDPAIEHDGGWWLQSPYQRQLIADGISQFLANPQPVIDGCEVFLSAPIHRGDRVQIKLRKVAQVDIDAVVVGTTVRPGDGIIGLTLRVTNGNTLGMTYGQHEDQFGHITYDNAGVINGIY